jgi:hypothetical protein
VRAVAVAVVGAPAVADGRVAVADPPGELLALTLSDIELATFSVRTR